MLIKYNLFIKDLSNKICDDQRQFVRIAVRNMEDNNVLLDALGKELGQNNK